MAANPFNVEQKVYVQFPNDEFIDVCVLSYQTADLPPGPLATTNDRVKSARFLMGGYVKDESGQVKCDDTGKPIVVRKWTRWMRVSNNERSAMMNTFAGFDNFFDILQDCEAGGKLWTTPMKMILEASEKYQNILKIKPGTNMDVVNNCFYSDEYIPYKVVKAYGNPERLTLAGCKFKSGVKTFTPEEMSDGDPSTNG